MNLDRSLLLKDSENGAGDGGCCRSCCGLLELLVDELRTNLLDATADAVLYITLERPADRTSAVGSRVVAIILA
jgi:hypothetical protein